MIFSPSKELASTFGSNDVEERAQQIQSGMMEMVRIFTFVSANILVFLSNFLERS